MKHLQNVKTNPKEVFVNRDSGVLIEVSAKRDKKSTSSKKKKVTKVLVSNGMRLFRTHTKTLL